MAESRIELPFPTNLTADGPIYRHSRSALTVEYDCVCEEDSPEWVQLVFDEVLALDYRQSICCRHSDILDARQMRVLSESPYRSDIVAQWQQAVGWQEWQQKQGGAARFKHFTLYFDDAGSINVVAASATVSVLGNRGG